MKELFEVKFSKHEAFQGAETILATESTGEQIFFCMRGKEFTGREKEKKTSFFVTAKMQNKNRKTKI